MMDYLDQEVVRNDEGQPLKSRALFPEERTKVCDHSLGFPYAGSMPCVGPRLCPLCNTRAEDA
ncbi:MAG: hypothetical protein ACPG1A_14250 [Halioglobus sp.]